MACPLFSFSLSFCTRKTWIFMSINSVFFLVTKRFVLVKQDFQLLGKKLNLLEMKIHDFHMKNHLQHQKKMQAILTPFLKKKSTHDSISVTSCLLVSLTLLRPLDELGLLDDLLLKDIFAMLYKLIIKIWAN